MHPSLRARYGLAQDVDVAVAELMMVAARKAGWSPAQTDGLLQFYATLSPALERGDITPDQAVEQLYDFAELQGIGTDERAELLAWFVETGSYIEAHGGELPALEKPAPAAIAAELAEIERVQREDSQRYWRDETLQHRMHDLIEQSRGEVVPLAVATSAHMTRLGELEKMMGDHNSAYWRPGSGEALQAEYRNILTLAPPQVAAPGAAALPAPGAAPAGGEPGGSGGEPA